MRFLKTTALKWIVSEDERTENQEVKSRSQELLAVNK